MGKKSRTKGASGEREIVAVCVRHGYEGAHRVAPMQAGHADKDYPDVGGVGRLWIESKRHKRVAVSGHLRELIAKERPGYVRVLAFREDGDSRWMAALELDELLKILKMADWAERLGFSTADEAP